MWVDGRVSLDPTAATVADDALHGLVAALSTREADRLCALFTKNASLFGSQDTDFAIGADELKRFFDDLCAQPVTFAWQWQVTAAGQDGDVVWFVAPGAAEMTGDDGMVDRIAPYRLSGVLRFAEQGWRFELFNGSEPTAI